MCKKTASLRVVAVVVVEFYRKKVSQITYNSPENLFTFALRLCVKFFFRFSFLLSFGHYWNRLFSSRCLSLSLSLWLPRPFFVRTNPNEYVKMPRGYIQNSFVHFFLRSLTLSRTPLNRNWWYSSHISVHIYGDRVISTNVFFVLLHIVCFPNTFCMCKQRMQLQINGETSKKKAKLTWKLAAAAALFFSGLLSTRFAIAFAFEKPFNLH